MDPRAAGKIKPENLLYSTKVDLPLLCGAGQQEMIKGRVLFLAPLRYEGHLLST